MAKKIAVFIIKLGVTIAAFAAIVMWVGPESLLEAARKTDPLHATLWILLGVFAKMLGITAGILRWNLLLRGQGLKLPFWYLAKCWFWGRTIGLWLPGTMGLDGFRLVESSAYTREPIKCTTVIAVEKLTGFIALFGLVFLTVPLGLQLFDINLVMLAAVLVFLAAFVTATLMLLLNPRVIQVLAAVLPVPARIQDKVNKLGVAVTAYSGQRRYLLVALGLALCVHLGICVMYFCNAMAIKAPNTSFLNIMFASPLVIVASVFGPTVSGAGARELVMGALLGGSSGTAAAVLFGHLGLWVGEAIPFFLSIPLLLATTRPKRDDLMEEAADVREALEQQEEDFNLPAEVVAKYRNSIINTLLAGLAAGLIGGAVIGFTEAGWIARTYDGLLEHGAFWWGPVVYCLLFAGVGAAIGGALLFLYLIFDRIVPPAITFGLSIGAVLAAGVLIIGRWRYQRDVLGEHALSMGDNVMVLAAALGVAVAGLVIGGGLAYGCRNRSRIVGGTVAAAALVLVILAGVAKAAMYAPPVEEAAFEPVAEASGPNIILVAVDTLRADYLKLYRNQAKAETPNIDAFARDSVLFASAFAQSSWTKASFGTIFTGMHPQAHNAVTKTAALPDDVETIAEGLLAGGYYTQGFPNNANIASLFNYGQGFVEYHDLLPDRYAWATESAAKLSLYEVVRRVVEKVNAVVLRGRITIGNFYQPAEVVTETALNWLDSPERPAGAPFYLFLHYMDPHDPFRDPERPGRGYARVQMPNPDPEMAEPFIRSYNYEIEYLDTQIGALFQGLKERGVYDDTLIVFTSDHGEEFCEHGGFWHGLSLYEEQIRIPFIVKLPGNQHAGARQTQIVRHVDLAPTLLLAAGLPAGDKVQGRPLFTPGGDTVDNQVTETFAHLDFEGIQLESIRTDDTKLIRSNENKRNYAPVELYNLEDDPGEQNNLSGTGQLDEQALLEALDAFQAEVETMSVESMEVDEIDPEELQRLRDLGYVGD